MMEDQDRLKTPTANDPRVVQFKNELESEDFQLEELKKIILFSGQYLYVATNASAMNAEWLTRIQANLFGILQICDGTSLMLTNFKSGASNIMEKIGTSFLYFADGLPDFGKSELDGINADIESIVSASEKNKKRFTQFYDELRGSTEFMEKNLVTTPILEKVCPASMEDSIAEASLDEPERPTNDQSDENVEDVSPETPVIGDDAGDNERESPIETEAKRDGDPRESPEQEGVGTVTEDVKPCPIDESKQLAVTPYTWPKLILFGFPRCVASIWDWFSHNCVYDRQGNKSVIETEVEGQVSLRHARQFLESRELNELRLMLALRTSKQVVTMLEPVGMILDGFTKYITDTFEQLKRDVEPKVEEEGNIGMNNPTEEQLRRYWSSHQFKIMAENLLVRFKALQILCEEHRCEYGKVRSEIEEYYTENLYSIDAVKRAPRAMTKFIEEQKPHRADPRKDNRKYTVKRNEREEEVIMRIIECVLSERFPCTGETSPQTKSIQFNEGSDETDNNVKQFSWTLYAFYRRWVEYACYEVPFEDGRAPEELDEHGFQHVGHKPVKPSAQAADTNA